ncbi:hypothetical protein [Archangium lansingense]|uniref:Mersacidin/lichenicidin family type 2 lantibiotic n=1 Tax=Archangium lansingense TaxID=2995310 RepID=A0ABT4AGH0_9BACT|nr:hypothetical protein [Archangium lansinium]MCY1080740.1 hypothetical protein [Archangium lansinium]
MNQELLTRAWKDPSTPPENLSGRAITELEDDELGDAVGGRRSQLVLTVTRPIIIESTTPETRWT